MKANLIILGAQKCATTTLFKILTRSPRIVGARLKEPHFFSTCANWKAELPRYEALFERRDGALYYCEASTSYTFYPHRNREIWNDLFAYNPRIKLIYVVRNPIDRILSSYVHNVARGYTRAPVEEFVLGHPLPLDASRYYTQIIPYIRRFGREQVLLLDFEDCVRVPQETMRAIAGFLGVDVEELGSFKDTHANTSASARKRHYGLDARPQVPRAVRRLLPGVWASTFDRFSSGPQRMPTLSQPFRRMIINLLELEIAALETLMERDLASWRRADDVDLAAIA